MNLQRCIIDTQGQFSVMLLTDSNTVISRTVTVGEANHGNWQITDGLHKGDQIVYEGLQKVRTGSAVTSEKIPFTLEEKK